MPDVVIIADDLTGAAEIAGIAADCGMRAVLRRQPGGAGAAIAYDTSTRQLSAEKAAARVEEFSPGARQAEILYKKTDSVLRGNVAAEAAALWRASGRKRVLLVPQNPSKRRVIRDGRYLIGDVPLEQTAFRHDPDHPRLTGDVLELLGAPAGDVQILPAGTGVPASGFFVGEAATFDDVRHWARQVDADTLPAGGADFFAAILGSKGLRLHSNSARDEPNGPTLIVCGSAGAYSRDVARQWHIEGRALCPLPAELFAGVAGDAGVSDWVAHIHNSLATRGHAILTITQEVAPARAAALRGAMAEAVRQALTRHTIPRLYIEGGATAAAVAAILGWDEFMVEGTVVPGVVALRPTRASGTQVVIKPGSYPWPPEMVE